MTQLRRGAKQVIDDFDQRLKDLLNTLCDPKIQSDVLDLRTLLHDEIKPMLQRAETAEPTAEMRQRALETRVAALEAWRKQVDPVLSAVEQSSAQHL